VRCCKKPATPPAWSGNGASERLIPKAYPTARGSIISTATTASGRPAELKELGLYENTLVVFTSDNGPTYAGGVDPDYFASAAPFQGEYGRGKGFLYEGGIRVPMIASWPGVIEPGSETGHVSAFQDVLPTLSEITGAEAPIHDGISFLPTLRGETQEEHPFLYWEFPAYKGQQAVRFGNWKAVRQRMQELLWEKGSKMSGYLPEYLAIHRPIFNDCPGQFRTVG